MKILFLSFDGMTDALGQSQVIPYLKGLSSKGHKIFIISLEKKEKLKSLKPIVEKLITDSNIVWIPLLYSKTIPIFSSIMNLLKIWKKAVEIVKKEKLTIIHCRSQLPAMIGLQLKKFLGVQLLYDMRGFWTDERVDGNLWSMGNPVYMFIFYLLKQNERQLLINSDHIIILTENAKNEIKSWKLIDTENLLFSVIPCCVDLNIFSYKKLDPKMLYAYKNNLQIQENDFILSYLGALGTWYLPDDMLNFFKRLLIFKPNAKFLFVTNEPKEFILSKVRQKNIPLEKIIMTQAQRNEVPYLINLSSVSLFFIKPAYSKKASSPVKQGEIMAMGIPVICNYGIGDTDEIIAKSKSGILLKDFSDDTFDDAIIKMDKLLMMDKTKISDAVQNLSLAKGIEKYDKIYNQLGGKNHS